MVDLWRDLWQLRQHAAEVRAEDEQPVGETRDELDRRGADVQVTQPAGKAERQVAEVPVAAHVQPLEALGERGQVGDVGRVQRQRHEVVVEFQRLDRRVVDRDVRHVVRHHEVLDDRPRQLDLPDERWEVERNPIDGSRECEGVWLLAREEEAPALVARLIVCVLHVGCVCVLVLGGSLTNLVLNNSFSKRKLLALQQSDLSRMPQCTMMKMNGHQCSRNATPTGLCAYHNRIQHNRNMQHNAERVWFEVLNQIWTDNVIDATPLIQMIHQAFERGEITEQLQLQLVTDTYDELEFARIVHVPVVQPRTELERLAQDSQNVHTGPVNKQTRENEKILLATEVPSDPHTLEEISNKIKDVRILRDITKWYNVKSCRKPDDYLYRRLLDALWIWIRDNPELLKRFHEEATESLKMCCEGHISRLCNVMVGFDDAFKPPVSTGELLQQKISAIAGSELSIEYKVGEVWIVFEELGIPMEDRSAWIEAL